MYWKKVAEFIKEFNEHCHMKNPKEDEEFFDTWELDMAKALLNDFPDNMIRVSKIILALKDIGDIKIKIE